MVPSEQRAKETKPKTHRARVQLHPCPRRTACRTCRRTCRRMWTRATPIGLARRLRCRIGWRVAHVILQARVACAPLAQPVEQRAQCRPGRSGGRGDAPAVSGGAPRRPHARARRGCTLGRAKPLVVCDDAGAKAEVECGKADRARGAPGGARAARVALHAEEACVGHGRRRRRDLWGAPSGERPSGVRASPARA